MKRATVRTKDQIENLIDDGQVTPSEYAEDQIKYAAEDTAEKVYDDTSRKVKQGRDRVQEQLRERRAEKKLEKAEQNKLSGERKSPDHLTMRRYGHTESFDYAQVKRKNSRQKEPERGASTANRTVRRARRVKKATIKTGRTVAKSAKAHNPSRQIQTSIRPKNTSIRTAQTAERSIKQTAKSTGKATVKTASHSAKTAQRTVKTAEQTSKAAIKTTKTVAETAPKAAEATAKAAKAAAIAAKKTAIAVGKAVVAAAKVVAKAAVAVGKAIASGFSALAAVLGTGGAIAVVVIAVLCGIAAALGSAFGVFFSSEDGTGKSMESVVREINTEYNERLSLIKEVNTYDEVEMSGSSAVWREVIAYYAVKTSMAEEDGQEVVTMDEEKEELLRDIFWEMNTISSEVKKETKIVIEEVLDDDGEVTEVEVEKEVTTLYITVSHLTADQMAEKRGLSSDQIETMHQLLSDEYRSEWSAVLYGIKSGETAIIAVAASQIGNEGGEPYWSHFGFTSRIPWCACFVTWCGNECGYIENGVMPNAIGCVVSMNWYKERGQWIDGNEEPVPGMIIFYDWDDPDGEFGSQDGKPDHTGIVEKVVDGVVWTIEGNSADSCRRNQHPVGEYVILGYGSPQY
ncbi:MAG: CHAP domain-containing protein [Firmicutes bacterium]|nr:CHAP domain-containing protein [Bacillota bacterium]